MPVVEFEADDRGVEVGHRDGGGFVEAQGRVAERKLRASVAQGREAVARVQRTVGQGGRRHFLRTLEGDLALDVGQARDAFRRLGRIASSEAGCRDGECDE